MSKHPLAEVEAASATLRQAMDYSELWRGRRNEAIATAKKCGLSVAYLMKATQLSRASVYAIVKQTGETKEPAESREQAEALLVATVAAVEKAEHDEADTRTARDATLIAARDAGLEVTAIAKAAGLNRTQLYAIFQHYST